MQNSLKLETLLDLYALYDSQNAFVQRNIRDLLAEPNFVASFLDNISNTPVEQSSKRRQTKIFSLVKSCMLTDLSGGSVRGRRTIAY